MGVRDRAAAGARNQADPGWLGRRRLGARRGRAWPESGAARCLPQAGQGMTHTDSSAPSGPQERLAALGLTLPPGAAPLGAYVAAGRAGAAIYTPGRLP